MYIPSTLLATFPILVCAKPTPNRFDSLYDFVKDLDNPPDDIAVNTITVPFNSQSAKCMPNASNEVFNENIQRRGSVCGTSVTAPPQISKDQLDRLEKLWTQEAKPTKPLARDHDDNCKDNSKPKFVTCGGPKVYTNAPDSQLEFILNCVRGKSIIKPLKLHLPI